MKKSFFIGMLSCLALIFVIGAGKDTITYFGAGGTGGVPNSIIIAINDKQEHSTNLDSWSALSASKVSLGLRAQIGVTSEDGTNTNTFNTVCASVPAIFVQTYSQTDVLTNTVTEVSTSNCVVNLGKAGVTYYLLAVERDVP